jgi:hypothetical protein
MAELASRRVVLHRPEPNSRSHSQSSAYQFPSDPYPRKVGDLQMIGYRTKVFLLSKQSMQMCSPDAKSDALTCKGGDMEWSCMVYAQPEEWWLAPQAPYAGTALASCSAPSQTHSSGRHAAANASCIPGVVKHASSKTQDLQADRGGPSDGPLECG